MAGEGTKSAAEEEERSGRKTWRGDDDVEEWQWLLGGGKETASLEGQGHG